LQSLRRSKKLTSQETLGTIEELSSLSEISADSMLDDCHAARLVVMLPALNEETTIAGVLGRIPREIEGVCDVRALVVDDGSTDRTAELARQSGAVVVSHLQNSGVGAAFSTGIEQALAMGADVIVNMDADGQFQPEDIPTLIRPILHDGYGFATCSRFADPDNIPHMPKVKLWGNRMMCRLVNAITGTTKFSDVSCGFRAYSRDTAMRLNLYGKFTYTQETLIDLAMKGLPMTEVPLTVRGVREHGKSRVASNLWHYGFNTSMIILRAYRDWKPLVFFGIIALAFLLLGMGLIGFVGAWWMALGQTKPYTQLITLGGMSVVLGITFGVLALVADQIGRGRRIQEQLLYLERQRFYATASESNGSG
jgi:glycosyltransferase involved in cell wall biosynthesis